MKNLKSLKTYVFTAVLLFTASSLAQTYETGKVRVIIKNPNCYPKAVNNTSNGKGNGNSSPYIQTTNNQFNQILTQFQVSSMVQCMPYAKTKELRDLYELTTPLGEDALFNSLNSLNSNKNFFLSVEKCAIPINLYDPADYMWTSYADDWLWHLKRVEADKAWDITLGDPNVKIAVIDDGVDANHPDLIGKFNPPYDFYDGTSFSPAGGHGTSVTTTLGGETTEQGETPNGQMASIGFNCKMMFSDYGNGLDKCVYASSVMDAKVISLSWLSGCSPTTSYLLAEQEILNNGTAIIRAAGNGQHHCGGGRVYPFSGLEDPRTIVISSTGTDDRHLATHINPNYTHSHYDEVDLCSPGYCIMTGTYSPGSEWPYYGCSGGTSFATPIVSGTAGLMLSVNPCLNNVLIQDILKNTTDPIADAASFPGKVGTGRVNAYKAVREAQATYSTDLDLYIKDRPEDFGRQDFPYHWQADRDESPDIWVRNQQDGFTNKVHQEPEYQSATHKVWVYVRVRNKSCMTSSGQENLSLYWTKASSWSSWPQNWDGTLPTTGNKIDITKDIPSLDPGEETIIEFEWDIINPYIHQNWGSCLLARIEDVPVDPITVYPGRLDDDVFYNNNIALRNVTIIDIVPGIAPVGNVNGIYYPHGKHIFIGNAGSTPGGMDFDFQAEIKKGQEPLLENVKIKMIFDQAGWDLMKEELAKTEQIVITGDRQIELTGTSLHVENIYFNGNTRIPVYIGFEVTDPDLEKITDLRFHFRQYLSDTREILGGVHFALNYDKNAVSTENQGNNGHGTVQNPNKIISISPNPAQHEVNVEYRIVQGTEAVLMVIDQTRAHITQYPLDITQQEIALNLHSMQPGNYLVVLSVNGEVQDSEALLITP
ncbi:MAG: peptidase and in kexin sedolisin [Crocinitomicaceae bacterium]|jgi:subtilisin family serine protease|nr:peptidase and in kexin sedolisin [Crocinitomicaceae bacterium]